MIINKKGNVQFIKRNQTEVKQSQNILCNCRNKDKCPLNSECYTYNGPIIYKAGLKDSYREKHTYIGSSINFKERYRNHTQSFRDDKYKNDTTLASCVWKKNLGPEPTIKWSVLCTTKVYKKMVGIVIFVEQRNGLFLKN